MDELFGKLNFKNKNVVVMSQRNEPLGIDVMVSVKYGEHRGEPQGRVGEPKWSRMRFALSQGSKYNGITLPKDAVEGEKAKKAVSRNM